ncbi:hypothetical protein ACET3Z_031879 [Daucus carota]
MRFLWYKVCIHLACCCLWLLSSIMHVVIPQSFRELNDKVDDGEDEIINSNEERKGWITKGSLVDCSGIIEELDCGVISSRRADSQGRERLEIRDTNLECWYYCKMLRMDSWIRLCKDDPYLAPLLVDFWSRRCVKGLALCQQVISLRQV